jgi:hypothetical protein
MRIEELVYNRGYRVDKDGILTNPKGESIGRVEPSGNLPYHLSSVKIDGRSKKFRTHRLQAFQKFGDKMYEEGICVRHLNGNSLDNSADNIEIGTHSDNMMDKSPEDRMKAALHATSFVRKYDKQEVRDFYSEHRSYKKTMDRFGISSKGTLNYILKS